MSRPSLRNRKPSKTRRNRPQPTPQWVKVALRIVLQLIIGHFF